MSGLCITATAVFLTMVTLRIEDMHRTAAAARVMTGAVLEDIASLVLFAILIPIATSEGTPDALDIFVIAAKAMLFLVAISLAGA